MKHKVCPYCTQRFICSRFHPDQVVCSSPECQRRRRADYHSKKLVDDPEYRAQCKDSRSKWKKNNPGYLKAYRATTKKGHEASNPKTPCIDDILRLLRHAKNTSAKNNVALSVTSGVVEVWWVSSSGARSVKNNLASCKVIVIEEDSTSDI